MTNTNLLPCDGCGQPASPDHLTARFARLELTTRYRPVHIGTLLLGAVAPTRDAEFLYSPEGEFSGEGGRILDAAGVARAGRTADAVLAEFQRGGFLVIYVLDCPVEVGLKEPAALRAALAQRLPAVLARIRRSLKPKRIMPISSLLEPLLPELAGAGCEIVLDGTKTFALDGASAEAAGRL
jgi:hypothetical protein